MKNKTWGGARPGAGRKPTGRKRRSLYATDSEYKVLREYLEKMREAKQ